MQMLFLQKKETLKLRFEVVKVKSRCFLITDIDTKMIVEETTRKDIIGYIDEHLENIEYGNDMSDYRQQKTLYHCLWYKI